jgi:glycosyltransferase involved in cell wall biosynthesis
MRIAWFHSHLLHPNSGGTRFVIDYAIGLKKKFNNELTVFCDCSTDEVTERLNKEEITVVELDTASTNNFFYWLTLRRRIARKRKKLRYIERDFDCIINSMFPMNVLVANFNIPKIQMCYEPFAFFYDAGFLKNFTIAQQAFFRLMKILYQDDDKAAVKKMDRLLTLNKTNFPKIEATYGRIATAVYAGIDPTVYHRASTGEISRIKEKHKGSPLLFHSSDLTGIKGTFPLLDVIKQVLPRYPKVKLLITVYVDVPDSINRLKNKIKELGLDSNIEYLGCLPKEELPLYYSSVDFVCQPSINQPANWPLKEAMLCQTPIIGGAESEEVSETNGAKINVINTVASAATLSALFATDRSKFFIDIEGLKRDYSIDSCLKQFNDIILSVHADKKNK